MNDWDTMPDVAQVAIISPQVQDSQGHFAAGVTQPWRSDLAKLEAAAHTPGECRRRRSASSDSWWKLASVHRQLMGLAERGRLPGSCRGAEAVRGHEAEGCASTGADKEAVLDTPIVMAR